MSMRNAVRSFGFGIGAAVVAMSLVAARPLGAVGSPFPASAPVGAPTTVAAWAVVGSGAVANHTCGVRTDHTLWCWGDNTYGQLGLGDEGFDLAGRYPPGSVRP